jgi:hypothetical protein
MKIYLKNISHYFLTVDTNGKRKYHMFDEFKDYDLTEVNPILNIGRNKSGATGFSKIIDLALRKQDRSKLFQPFVIYEDDCSKYREFPEYIEIPDDADFCYIGLSLGAMDNISHNGYLCYTHINSDIIRVYNMLAMHGTIICSPSGALAIQKAMLEGYFKDVIWDIFTAQIQPYYNVYALKIPLVYQDSKYGGVELSTRFSITSQHNYHIPNQFINTTNVSIITCSNSNIYDYINTMNTYINRIETAFDNAERCLSKITLDIIRIKGTPGIKTRHFYNNLLDTNDSRYLEIGTWKGSSICSAMCNNKATVVCIDNWSQYECSNHDFLLNFNTFKGENNATFIESDCFELDISILHKFNIFLYDGNTTSENYYKALLHYYNCFDDVFIFIVDNWNSEDIQNATTCAIQKLNLHILYEKIIKLNWDVSQGIFWWNELYVVILQK